MKKGKYGADASKGRGASARKMAHRGKCSGLNMTAPGKGLDKSAQSKPPAKNAYPDGMS